MKLSRSTASARPGSTWTFAALLVAMLALGAPAAPVLTSLESTAATPASTVSVLFAAQPGSDSVALSAVEAAGGHVTRRLGVINAYVATLPSATVRALGTNPAFAWIAPDRAVKLSHTGTSDPAHGATSVFHVGQTVRANKLWDEGVTGAGVDVAVIDSGVVPVNGLSAPGKVVNGPDLSFESGNPETRHLDTYGHGTHMAGIIAGRDDASPLGSTPTHANFSGIAPGARIVNIKVADSAGATDVSQVIAAIDWVVQHRQSNGLNIRVLNLSFGTDGVQDYRLDPLAYAVEQAWHHGVVVVTAAGNEGHGDARMNNPAYDPYVLAVGGSHSRGTIRADDDTVAPWSSRGDTVRRPDVVAPGQSILSLRDPGSSIDLKHSGARVGKRFFRGSGTSQAAAVVSGSAALLLQQRPQLTPDQVKALLMSTSKPLAAADEAQGAGMIDLKHAGAAPTPTTVQSWPRATGTGSLELVRGTDHVAFDGVALVGEKTVFGSWDGDSWRGNSWRDNSGRGSSGRGSSSRGNSGRGNSERGNSWTGNSWTGNSWTGNSWTGNSWTGNSWTGNSWTGNSWTGNSWTGNSWTSSSWPSDD